MPHFDAIIRQKSLLRKKLLQSQSVVNLLCNTGNNVVDFENIKTGSKSPAASLIKTHFYVPGTQQVLTCCKVRELTCWQMRWIVF